MVVYTINLKTYKKRVVFEYKLSVIVKSKLKSNTFGFV